MTASVRASRAVSSPRRALRALCVAALLLAPPALVLLAVEAEPRVADWAPADGVAAEQARGAAERLRALMDDGDVRAGWTSTEAEINAVLASAARLVPGMRGRASLEADRMTVEASVGTPLLPSGLWANLRVAFADADDGLHVLEARVGRLPLPPALAEAGLRFGLDRALGPGSGTEAMQSVAALAVSPEAARLTFRTDAEGRVPLLEMIRARARGAAGASARELAAAQLAAIQAAVRSGRLPRDGSFLPYLAFVIDAAAGQPGPERARARGALYALALYCGDPGFETVIGVSLPGRMLGARNGCAGTTLAGRDDLRRHFVLSAGLDAATSSSAAFGVGELKELLDTNPGGSGFSFDDMTADVAGVRFARTFLAAGPDGWAALAARVGDEGAVLPSLAGLPSGLSSDEFVARYGSVDSDAYAALVAEIDRRVDALPLHASARF